MFTMVTWAVFGEHLKKSVTGWCEERQAVDIQGKNANNPGDKSSSGFSKG